MSCDFFDFYNTIINVIVLFLIYLMIKFLYWFTIFLCTYFILYVTGNYYLESLPYVSYVFPVLKELSWFVFVWYCMWQGRVQLLSFIFKTKREVLLLLGIMIWGIVATLLMHWLQSSTLINIAIWLKYGLYSSIIFYTAARVGYSSPLTQSDIINYIKRICHMIIWSLVIWFVWQWLKWIFPEWFYTILWYGPVGDYMVWQAHPIYYRTWPWGWPRFSWLMSGPNNLWYLLVAYASLIPLYITSWRWRLAYYAAMLMTLSRAALIGVWAQWFTTLIRRYGRQYRWWIIALIVLAIAAIVLLSIFKGTSTLEHMSRTWWAIIQVIQHPRGIGLGSSWPWVHWNGSVLPENFYLQLLLDYGTIPFIAWCIYWIMIIRRAKTSISQFPQLAASMRGYIAWLMGLLLVGLFLHVFEDSVVNYLFFIPFGLVWWYSLRGFAKSDTVEYNGAK